MLILLAAGAAEGGPTGDFVVSPLRTSCVELGLSSTHVPERDILHSSGSSADVLVYMQIRAACTDVKAEYRPKITFVVVQKRCGSQFANVKMMVRWTAA